MGAAKVLYMYTCTLNSGVWSLQYAISLHMELYQEERTKFDRFVDPNVRRTVYESIAIELFLRQRNTQNMYMICVPRFDKKKNAISLSAC